MLCLARCAVSISSQCHILQRKPKPAPLVHLCVLYTRGQKRHFLIHRWWPAYVQGMNINNLLVLSYFLSVLQVFLLQYDLGQTHRGHLGANPQFEAPATQWNLQPQVWAPWTAHGGR